MVYNSDKKFIESCSMNREGKIISNPLKEGVYTLYSSPATTTCGDLIHWSNLRK